MLGRLIYTTFSHLCLVLLQILQTFPPKLWSMKKLSRFLWSKCQHCRLSSMYMLFMSIQMQLSPVGLSRKMCIYMYVQKLHKILCKALILLIWKLWDSPVCSSVYTECCSVSTLNLSFTLFYFCCLTAKANPDCDSIINGTFLLTLTQNLWKVVRYSWVFTILESLLDVINTRR